MPEPRVVLIDLETAPNLSYVWGRWEQNVIDVKKHWYILSFCWKVLGERKIHSHSLPDYKQANKEDDRLLVHKLWEVMDAADIIIAHNGDRFDIRKANARFVAHGLEPPRPYKTVDTLKVARKHFQFDSNKLDHLGAYLGVGRKLPHTGPHLWFGCMSGDPRAWKMMLRYNAQDVALLERVYLKLRPWATNHPNLDFYTRKGACPACQSLKVVNDGFVYCRTGKRQREKCSNCGHRYVVGGLIREPTNV